MSPTLRSVTTLEEFAAGHAHLDAGAFLDVVVDPYLLTSDAGATPDPVASATTVRVGGVRRSDGEGSTFVLYPVRRRAGADVMPGMVSLGRAPSCDLVLGHPRLSRFQAFFRRVHGRWHVDDACSTNGTTVDGQPVVQGRSTALSPGSRIVLADAVEVVFLDPVALFELVADLRGWRAHRATVGTPPGRA